MQLTYDYAVAFGSNIEPRADFIAAAFELMKARCGKIVALSSVYETSPVGAASRDFLNGVAILTSKLDPEAFLGALQEVELALGRLRRVKWGNRTIDLDIILCRSEQNSVKFLTEDLKIPHPHYQERSFVLLPLLEVAANWILPEENQSLIAFCQKQGHLEKMFAQLCGY